ncbi:MAG: polyamine ABC transporter substrate-binding protein [Burkholderiaceae bacterium]
MLKKHIFALSAAVLLAACGQQEEQAAAPADTAAVASTEEKILNIYNWPDYISESMIPDFEKETGIKVNYQTFETNEALHAKLVAGNSGYDIVMPGSVFAKPQIDGGLLQKLDKSKLSNYGNLDAGVMQKLELVDPGNQHIFPWGWGFTTVGINKVRVEKALGGMPMPDNAWDLVFDAKYTSKLKSCGIAFLDSPTEIVPVALHYVGKDAYSNDPEDYKAALEMLEKVRPDVRLFSSTLIDDLAGGKACVAIGWSGDINIARERAVENESTEIIEALLPTTGALIFFDTVAIPADAKHVNNAHLFMDYFLRPEVSATFTNEMQYPAGNKAAKPLVEPAIANNPTIYVDDDNMSRMVPPGNFTALARESMSNVYTAFKKGN